MLLDNRNARSWFLGSNHRFYFIHTCIGTGLVWLPMAVYMLIIGHIWQGIFIVLFGRLVMGTLDNVVRFILAKKMADVHPIITVLG
jgi:predicted PurR-regulated permease PerM